MGVILHSFQFTVTYRPGTRTPRPTLSLVKRGVEHPGPARTSSREDPASSYSMGHNDRNCPRQPSDSPPPECPANLVLSQNPSVSHCFFRSTSPSSGHPELLPRNISCEIAFGGQHFDRHDSLHPQLQHVQHHQSLKQLPAGLLQPLPHPDALGHISPSISSQTYPTPKVTRLSSPLSTAFPKPAASYLCLNCLLPSRQLNYYATRCFAITASRWHRLRPWPPVHVKGMVSLLQSLNVNVSLTPATIHIQRPDRASQPGGHPLPSLLLSTTADRVESIPDVGWVCPELSDQTRHRYDPFQVCPRISPPMFPGPESRRVAFDYRMATTQRGGLGPSSHPSATQSGARNSRPIAPTTGPVYQPGQWVWLSTRDLRLRLPCKKLSPRYVGPFKISRQITPVSFRLELPSNYRISPTFHVSLLKPSGGPRGASEEGADPQTPPPILVDGEEAYRVHELLNSRRRGGCCKYLVDWEGFGPEERSWVNSGDILDPTLTEEFHRSHPERPPPPTTWKTPASSASSRQEPLAGGGLCHDRGSRTGLSPPPEEPSPWVLTFPSLPVPGADCSVTPAPHLQLHI